MSDILIRGRDMPTSCDMCWALDDYGDYPRCRITEEQRGYNFPIREKRMDKCPLVEIQSHGRLGDLDKLVDRLNDLERTTKECNPPDDIHGFNNGLLCGISQVIGEVRYYTPTVIEADESDMDSFISIFEEDGEEDGMDSFIQILKD